MKQFTIKFYEDEKGNTPVDDFLDELKLKNPQLYLKTQRDIQLLKEEGFRLEMPHVRKIEGKNGIFELRSKQSTNIGRVLYFFYDGTNIILTNGFVKKTDKTPPEEIKRAIRRKKDYLRRKQSDG